MKRGTLTPREIERIRTRAGLSREEMAVKLGVSSAAVYAYEKGIRSCPEIRERIILEVQSGMRGTREA